MTRKTRNLVNYLIPATLATGFIWGLGEVSDTLAESFFRSGSEASNTLENFGSIYKGLALISTAIMPYKSIRIYRN